MFRSQWDAMFQGAQDLVLGSGAITTPHGTKVPVDQHRSPRDTGPMSLLCPFSLGHWHGLLAPCRSLLMVGRPWPS